MLKFVAELTGTCIVTCGCTGTDAGASNVDYHLTSYVLVRFRDRIYASDSSELKKVIFREFHGKPYSSQPRYQKTLAAVKKFYYWLNLKKDVAEFLARCFNFQWVKANCKHPGGLL